jgi:polar amino acid transport system substrate-binding protein
MLSKLIKIAVSTLTAALFATGAAYADLDDIIERGKVVIAVPQDFAPFGSVGPDLKPEGYDVDVARLIAKDLEVELELIPVTSANRIPFLQSGKVDIVISSMGANPGRAKSIWFTAPYAPFFSGVFAAPEKAIASPEDMSGMTIAVTRGTLEDLELTDMIDGDTTMRRFEDNATTIAAYLSGQADVLVTGNVIVAKMAEDNPDVAIETKFVIKNSPAFMGIAKGDMDLLQWLDIFILHKKLGGDLDDLSMKWFGQPLPPLPSKS